MIELHAALEGQLRAMSGRLESVFATAADVIASGELDETLARITDRAVLQLDLTQKEVANRVGTSHSFISKLAAA